MVAQSFCSRVKVAVIAEFYKRFRILFAVIFSICTTDRRQCHHRTDISLTISGFSLFHTCSNKWVHVCVCVCVCVTVCVRTFTSQIVFVCLLHSRYFHFLIVRACPKTKMTQSMTHRFRFICGHHHYYYAEEGVAIQLFSEFELFKRAHAYGNLCRWNVRIDVFVDVVVFRNYIRTLHTFCSLRSI